MPSIVYLGHLPKASQAVSTDLKSRGIPLLKAAPSDFKPLILSNSPPTYGVYKHSLSSYIRAAETGTHVLLSDPYHQFGNTALPPFMKNPSIVFSFDTAPTSESRDALKATFSAEDTLVKGKPALKAELTLESVRSLISQYNPIQTTAGTTSSMNLFSYKQYILLHRLFDTLCKTHQYAYYDRIFEEKTIEMDASSIEKVEHMPVGEKGNDPVMPYEVLLI